MNDLIERWLRAKEAEQSAATERQAIEDMLIARLEVDPAAEGVQKREVGSWTVRATNRFYRKVDVDVLQAITRETDLGEHARALFRWKAELNTKQWRITDASITNAFLPAITTTKGRTSFAIETTKE